MLRRRLPTTHLAEWHARILEIEVGHVLIELASGLSLAGGELLVGQHIPCTERFGALHRNAGHLAAGPFALEIRIAPRRSRRTIVFLRLGDEHEADDDTSNQCGGSDLLHGLPRTLAFYSLEPPS